MPAPKFRLTNDTLDHIRQFFNGPCANQYTIDIWGNLNKMLALPGSGKPECDRLDQMANDKNQFIGFTYDAAGNLSAYGSDQYSYDAENRLTSVAGVAYTYDGDGKRVKKSNGKLYWYGMSADALLETNASGGNETEFIFFGGKSVARRDPDPGAAVFYFFADHLGSSRVVTNSSGGIVEDSDYYPYGREQGVVDTLADQNYKFTGKERDSESGLDFFIARHYSSALGRFLQPDEFTGGPVDAFSSSDPLPPGPLPYADIINPQSLNKYAYAYNAPLRYADPNGHNPIVWRMLWAAGVRIAASPAGQRVLEAVTRYGTAAYNWATRFFNSPAGHETVQTVAELATGTQMPSTPIGALREKAVAELVGGTVSGMKVTLRNVGSTDVDVLGKAGEYIAVGGPAKGLDMAKLGQKLNILKGAAEEAGVKAQAYFVEGTPEKVLKLAKKILGEQNVHIIPEPKPPVH